MDKLTLIKVGGKIVEEQETLSRLLVAFAAIPEKKVLVHGGGRSATAMDSRLGRAEWSAVVALRINLCSKW